MGIVYTYCLINQEVHYKFQIDWITSYKYLVDFSNRIPFCPHKRFTKKRMHICLHNAWNYTIISAMFTCTHLRLIHRQKITRLLLPTQWQRFIVRIRIVGIVIHLRKLSLISTAKGYDFFPCKHFLNI